MSLPVLYVLWLEERGLWVVKVSQGFSTVSVFATSLTVLTVHFLLIYSFNVYTQLLGEFFFCSAAGMSFWLHDPFYQKTFCATLKTERLSSLVFLKGRYVQWFFLLFLLPFSFDCYVLKPLSYFNNCESLESLVLQISKGLFLEKPCKVTKQYSPRKK